MSLYTTLALIEAKHPCSSGWAMLLSSLTPKQREQRDRRIPIKHIIKSNGVADALWALRCVPESQATKRDKVALLFAIKCAKRSLPIFEKRYPEDKRPRQAIEVAYRYAMGRATKEDLFAAWAAARFAAWAAAWAAAGDAAGDAAWAAARFAAWAAAGDAESRWQARELARMLTPRKR